jgi:NADPH:quinone reductase-like Zn-dependent oxidoreductase
MARRKLPKEMRAAALDHFGSPDVVHTEQLPVPRLAQHDVLVRVGIAGVGTWDPELVSGSYEDVRAKFPRVLGSDGAGTVVAVGTRVRRFAAGDRVYGWGYANKKGGFFSEYAVIDEHKLAAIPEGLAFEEAGVLAVSGITALQGLEQLGLEGRGEKIAVFGASGGLGHIAVQLARAMGLRVFAVASGDDGVALVKRLGVDAVAEGHDKSLVRELRSFAPGGLDGAVVFAGARGWERELGLLKDGAVAAWPNGVEPAPIVRAGSDGISYDGEPSRAAFDRLNELVAQGPFHVEIAARFGLSDTSHAIAAVQHHHLGKVAVVIGET